MSAWVLPDHIADVLPSEARSIEDTRRKLLDTAGSYGYELVIPPLVEHIESLLTGSGKTLALQTFKLVDLLSGRTLGVRADMTQQVARIDAHMLNRPGVTRLCYCGPVLHTFPDQPHATREPLQFGAELYGCSGVQADFEVLSLAIDALRALDAQQPVAALLVDLSDARIVPALLAQAQGIAHDVGAIQSALITKNANALSEAAAALPDSVREALQALLALYGDRSVLARARSLLPALPAVTEALDQLDWIADQIVRTHPGVEVLFDLADSRGYSYYSGVRFALYGRGSNNALVRGGRYDEVGAVYGRNRPAVGFSLDVKALAATLPPHEAPAAVLARWSDDPAWREVVMALRQEGQTVVVALPGQPAEAEEGFRCDRELLCQSGSWQLVPVDRA